MCPKTQVSLRLSVTVRAKVLLICGIIFQASLDICGAWSSVKHKTKTDRFRNTHVHGQECTPLSPLFMPLKEANTLD